MLQDAVDTYFGWEADGEDKYPQRQIRVEEPTKKGGSHNLYMQLGWLDSVGIWKGNSVAANQTGWEVDSDVRAYDHLPMRATVLVNVGDGRTLKIWLGFMKLDEIRPTPESVQALLYSSYDASAENADVIAMYFTDLLVDRENAEHVRQLLKRSVNDKCVGKYVFNEDDHSLSIRHIPAQLVQVKENVTRYVSMHIAVNKTLVQDFDRDGDFDHHDCFPEACYVTCKSARKNEYEPGFKSILAQSVLLHMETGHELDLLLLGANMDTNDDAKLGQLESLERMLMMQSRGKHNYCALIWGDFNNRLVAFDEMRPHVIEKSRGKYEITQAGIQLLVDCFKDSRRRRELLQKDALVFNGYDVAGNQFIPHPSLLKLRNMFRMSIDAGILVPMPTYKVQPLSEILRKCMGRRIAVTDVAVVSKIQAVPGRLAENVEISSGTRSSPDFEATSYDSYISPYLVPDHNRLTRSFFEAGVDVEVYSHSLGCWLRGVVDSVYAFGAIDVSFHDSAGQERAVRLALPQQTAWNIRKIRDLNVQQQARQADAEIFKCLSFAIVVAAFYVLVVIALSPWQRQPGISIH